MDITKNSIGLIKVLMTIILYPLKYLVIKGNIVVLSGPDSYSYCDNCRHLYEYLSKDKTLKVYWYTDSTAVKEYLKSKNHSYISKSNIFILIITLLRTKIMINSGNSYVNLFGIIDNPFTYKICTNHGSGPKLEAEIMTKELLMKLHKFNFLNYPSAHVINKLGKELYRLPIGKVISLGYPRCDSFFNPKHIKNMRRDKRIIKSILNDEFDSESKFIFYTPTWRKNSDSFPLLDMANFDYNKFNDWLINKNIYFLFTSHLNIEMNNVNHNYKRIKMIDRKDHHLLDTNNLMLEIDILLNDYSTTSVDFSILNKPQIFFFPNGNIYSETDKKDKINSGTDFIDYYRDIIPGEEITDYKTFINRLEYIIDNEKEYLTRYHGSAERFLYKYLYKEPKCSSEIFKEFIHNLMRS